ncbi:MAG: DUF1997 domain-containing protein [Synechococcales cyanobacterium C42_A2020_086]|jgi:hypothetical protein|nr:DUF1997 domain-containing protein [Synechococcales cyanobacterium M58_A2018_015]MBF2074294.1 DUF1997 domain-containing protein [Synechococcales cyanobacterium C42_A2020_086]
MQVCFFASQSVELAVSQQPIPIQHYLRQPQRLIKALVEPSRVEPLSEEHFRLKMRPLNFVSLTVQPTVDMRVWAEPTGVIHLRSVGCEIRGVEYINQRFHLDLVGQLSPQQITGQTYLQGQANLRVQVALPPPLWFTPKPLLETAGNGLLRSVLLTIKQRLVHQLLSDYAQWVETQLSVANPATMTFDAGSLLPSNSSV